MKGISILLLIFALFFACSLSSKSTLQPKQLAGPPSEFHYHDLPSPIDGALKEDSFLLTTFALPPSQVLELQDGKVVKSIFLPVDSQDFSFVVFTHPETISDLSFYAPDGTQITDLKNHAVPGILPFGKDFLRSTTYQFTASESGMFKLDITFFAIAMTEEQVKTKSVTYIATLTDAIVVVWNNSPIKIFSHLNTYQSLLNTEIGVVAQLYNDSANPLQNNRPIPLDVIKVTAELSMVFPNGTIATVSMHDDGLHGDLAADDGIYGGKVMATKAGYYLARPKLNATLSSGQSIVRSTQHVMAVLDGDMELTGSANGFPKKSIDEKDDKTILISLEVESENTPSASIFRVYSQVWGTDKQTSQLVPACWVSTVASPRTDNDNNVFLDVELNLQWLQHAGVNQPLVLKNISIQDMQDYIILSHMDQIDVHIDDEHKQFVSDLPPFSGEITHQMRNGRMPDHIKSKIQNPTTTVENKQSTSGKVVLVHGYCSPSNPWQEYAADWTDALYFLSANANDSNDQFARKIEAFVDPYHLDGYSTVGYSQGGMAIAHLANFYWSGLDVPKNGRVLQSVVTPFQGDSAAGVTASLGKLFGVGCGSDYDLTRDGATLWLSGITSQTRAMIYFYYVTYNQDIPLAKYCNAATNLFLQHPNDGVTEQVFAQLPGGNDCGLTTGFCHTKNMHYPPAFSDETRNKLMNSLAARS